MATKPVPKPRRKVRDREDKRPSVGALRGPKGRVRSVDTIKDVLKYYEKELT